MLSALILFAVVGGFVGTLGGAFLIGLDGLVLGGSSGFVLGVALWAMLWIAYDRALPAGLEDDERL